MLNAQSRPSAQIFSIPSLAAVASVVFGVALLVTVVVLTRATREDFGTYYAAGMAVRNGQSVYTDALAWRDAHFTVNLPAPAPTEGSPFVYTPVFALAMVPLTFLSPAMASMLWYVGMVLCVAGSVWILSSLLFPVSAVYRLPLALGLALLASLFGPIRTNFAAGQTDILLLLMLTLTFASFARGRMVRAGLWLAIGVAIKPTVIFLALFFLWKRGYRALIAMGALGLVFLVAPLPVFGLGAMWDFLSVGGYWSSADFAITPTVQSPYGMLLRLFTANAFTMPIGAVPWLATVARYLIPLLVLAALPMLVSRSLRMPVQRLAVEYGLVIVAMLVATPVSEDNHFTFLVLPFLAMASSLVLLPLGSRARVLAWLGLAVTFAYLSWPNLRMIRNAFYAYYQAPLEGPTVLLTGVYLYGLLAAGVLIVLLNAWWRRHALLA